MAVLLDLPLEEVAAHGQLEVVLARPVVVVHLELGLGHMDL